MEIMSMPFPEKIKQDDIFHINIVGIPCIAHIPHDHDYFQIYYVINSQLVHHVESESSILSHGDMFIVPPGKTHYVELQSDTRFYCLSFYPDFLDIGTSKNSLALQFLNKLQSDTATKIKPKLSIEAEDIFYIETIMAHILKEFTGKRFGYEETLSAYTTLLVTMFARVYFEETVKYNSPTIENNKQYVLNCIKYIENNFASDITLEAISKRSAMSKSSFCSLFYQLTGYSFNHYLNRCRIKKATEYIKWGYKITGIYGLCGYNTFSSFHRNFKNIMGVTPQEYKNMTNKPHNN